VYVVIVLGCINKIRQEVTFHSRNNTTIARKESLRISPFQQTPSTMTSCYIHFSIATLAVLSLFAQKASAVCEEKYAADFASARDPPVQCSPFEGSPTLYAVVYGCNSPNQEEEANIVSQSFTQICTAQTTTGTNFTCYGEFRNL
jgi:hypothetical protein